MKKLLLALLSVTLLGLSFTVPSGAIQQNEIILDVDFDGTASFADPLDDGSGNGVHTPGEDGGPANNVVRTNDQIQYRIDWNVNESDGTAVTVKMVLPEGMTWIDDATTTSGLPAGCASGSNTGLAGRELVCITDTEHEGSNGAIHPRAFVGALYDGDVVAPTASIETDEEPPVTSNAVETTISARPKGDWVKGKVVKDAESGDIIGYEPDEEIYDVDNNGVNGRIFVWSLRLVPAGGLKGAEPMNDAIPIQFFDHMWFAPGSAVLATGLMPNGRTACGGYDGTAGYPYGSAGLGTPAQTSAGTWVCTDQSASTGYGYPVVQVDITGHDTNNPATNNADGAGNSSTLISGQIAFWMGEDQLQNMPNPAIIANAIAAEDTQVTDNDSIAPIQVHGTNGPVDEAEYGLNNASPYEFPPEKPTGGSPGRTIRHWLRYQNGPYSEFEVTDPNTEIVFRGFDSRAQVHGGTGYNITAGGSTDVAETRWDGDGRTPRGNVMTIVTSYTTQTSRSPAGDDFAEPIHACVAIDPTHQELIPFEPTFNVSAVDPHPTLPSLVGNRATIGGSTDAVSSPLVQVQAGLGSTTTTTHWVNYPHMVVTNRGDIPHIVEVAAGAVTPGPSVAEHGVTCNEADANGLGWVEASGDLSAFDADGDGRYEGITHVRVRGTAPVAWTGPVGRGVTNYGAAYQVSLQVRVKDNPATGFQEADQELFAYSSRGWGEWDGTGQPPTTSCTNGPGIGAGNTTSGVTGWCNLAFTDDSLAAGSPCAPATASTCVDDFKDDYDGTAVENTDTASRIRIAHHDVVYIVEAALKIGKSNLDGAADIVVNGDIVEFEVNPAVVGSSLDAINNVTVTDALSANYEFVGFTLLPSTAGATCAYTTQIVCTFGDHVGGWSDTIRYQVRVKDAGANATLKNTAKITGDDPLTGAAKTPAQSSANSFTPAGYEESGIVKDITDHIGPCPAHPTDDPAPAGWADRCDVIGQNSGIVFDLTAKNEGNLDLTNYRIIDVLPWVGDGTEPASTTLTGDGRTPPSAFAGTLDFVSITGTGTTFLYSADPSASISRDPEVSDAANTWCSAPAGGTATIGAGACPATAADVTAVRADLGTLKFGETRVLQLSVDTEGNACDDIYTNTYGARTDGLKLPIRSNDVTAIVGFCDAAIDIEKDTNGVQSDTAPGESIAIGDPITWTYVVANTGGTAIADATVTDSQGVIVDCDIDDDGTFDGTNVIPFLAHGGAVTCQGTGTADTTGQYMNSASVEGTGVVPNPETCGCDITDPTTWPTDASLYEEPVDPITGEPVFPLDDADDSHYWGFKSKPAIDIEKDTNGAQSDEPTGQNIAVGDPITWTYQIVNSGSVPISPATVTDSEGLTITCAASLGDAGGDHIIDILLPGETVSCTATGVAIEGPYNNTGTVSGPALTPPPGCECSPKDPSTWPTDPDGYDPLTDPDGEPVTVEDEDDSNYFGGGPAIDIEKDTNGDQADTTTGPNIPAGGMVTWTYVVTNTGNTALATATVTDSQGVTVDCDVDGDGAFDGTNIIPFLAPTDSVTCEATGAATPGPYENTASVSGDPQLPDFGACDCDPDDPATWPTDAKAYSAALDEDGEPFAPVNDADDSHYFGTEPGVDIEKDTNGVQSDDPVGENIAAGDPVTWTYVVANTGNTALLAATVTDSQGLTVDCDVDGDGVFDGTNVIALLPVGGTVTCQATGLATAGAYENTADVTGTPALPDFATCDCDPDDPATWPTDPEDFTPPADENGDPVAPVTDADDSHFFGADPKIDIEKDTNGEQADETSGPNVPIGDPVTWTYVVTNTGNTALANATVTDNQGVTVDCDVDGDGAFDGTNVIPFLAPAGAVTCQATGVSVAGPYENTASVSGDPQLPDFDTCECDPDDPTTWPTDPADYAAVSDADGEPFGPVSDEDDSHYFGGEASIDIEKDTNGDQADDTSGPVVPTGGPVTWTYVVTNTGNTALANATVTDNQGVTVDCDVDGDGTFDGTNVIPLLIKGASVTCQATGAATPGAYENTAGVSGDPVVPDFDNCDCDEADPSTWPTDPSVYSPLLGPDGEPVPPVTDADDSHYFGADPGVDVEKSTNGDDADTTSGPNVPAGGLVTWTYVVTNTGNTALADATVTDSQGVVVDCDVDGDGVFDGTNMIPFLAPTASVTCEGTGEAVPGPYENTANVLGAPVLPDFVTCECDPSDPTTWPADPADYGDVVDETGAPVAPVGDADDSHYFGAEPSVDIEKDTNGDDADTAPGPEVLEGAPVTWTYVVTNTGNTALANATVTDSQGVVVSCDIDGDGVFDGTNVIPLLAVGAGVTCRGTGVAAPGPYMNTAGVVGDPVVPDPATCGCDPADPATWPSDPGAYGPLLGSDGEPVAPVGDEDDSHYEGIPVQVLSGTAFTDGDNSGVQGGGEGPAEGVTITLYGPNAEVLGTTVTGPNGEWSFDVPPGDYTVSFEPPAGMTLTGPQNTGPITVDPGVDVAGIVIGINNVPDLLAFTGSDVAGMVALGLLLVSAGYVFLLMRRRRLGDLAG